jgi:DNA-directed RNA polymerase subunit RPC12/RpoP
MTQTGTQMFRCHQCKREIEVTSANADMVVKCPGCGTKQVAPRLRVDAVAKAPDAAGVDSATSDVKTAARKQPKVGFLAWAFLALQFKVSYAWLGSIGWALAILGIPRFWNARAGATDSLVQERLVFALLMMVVLAVLAFFGGYALYRSEDSS